MNRSQLVNLYKSSMGASFENLTARSAFAKATVCMPVAEVVSIIREANQSKAAA